MATTSGYLRIGRFRGAAVRLHWTVPLGAVVFTGIRLAPGAWLGFFVLLLVHELGHALAVVQARLRLVAVDVLGIGGLCRYDGHPTPRRRVLIAWAGVLAQAALGLLALVARLVLGRPAQPFAADLLDALLQVNAWLVLVNLLPIPPLDGAEAWGVIALVRAARASRRLEAARAAEVKARAALSEKHPALDELDDDDLPPMPEEVRRVLDRITAEARAAHESERKNSRAR
jgi:Zn-dependent protease